MQTQNSRLSHKKLSPPMQADGPKRDLPDTSFLKKKKKILSFVHENAGFLRKMKHLITTENAWQCDA